MEIYRLVELNFGKKISKRKLFQTKQKKTKTFLIRDKIYIFSGSQTKNGRKINEFSVKCKRFDDNETLSRLPFTVLFDH